MTARQHARHQLDPAFKSPIRFSIVACLAGVDETSFARLRDRVEISDATLSKHAAALEGVGYVKIRKGYLGKRPKTWLSLKAKGRSAFDQHVDALHTIAAGVDSAELTSTTRQPKAQAAEQNLRTI